MSKKSEIFKYAVGSVCLIAMGVAEAAEMAVSEDSSAPSFRLGGVSVYPGLSIVEKSDSNIARSNLAKKSSMVTVVSPSVVLQAKKAADIYSLAYRADVGRYSRSHADNFVDHQLLGAAELAFSTRATLRLTPEYKIGHDDRGSTYGAATLVPNEWHSSAVGASFVYGAEESRGRIVLDAGYLDRQYQNNRALTTAYDKTLRDVGGSFYFRVLPKISAFVQATDTRIAYKDPVSTLSGNEQRYMLGVTWAATAQTSGKFKVGQLQKKFDSAARPAFNGTSWEGGLRWSPREFARVDLVSGRTPSESTGVGNFVMVTNHTLDLGYDLSDRTTLHFNAGKVTEDFRGSARTDNTQSYGVKAEYKLRSWLVGAVEFTDSAKTSTTPVANYNRRIFAVSIRSEL